MEIKLDPRNYRKHDQKNKDLINKSLKECGAGRSIVIDNEDNIIAGNGIYEQAQKLGLKTKVIETDGSELVVVKRTDLATEDEKRKQLAIMDNSTSDTSTFDFEILQADFDTETLIDYGLPIDFKIEDPQKVVEDDVPETVDTRCKRGDIWKLGNHRLMCGDSLIQDDIDKLLDGEYCELTFTDPPYQITANDPNSFITRSSYIQEIKKNKVDTFDPSQLLLQSETNIFFHNKPLIKQYIELAESNNKPYDLCFYKKENPIPNYKGHLLTDCEYIAIIGKLDPQPNLNINMYSKCYIGQKDKDNSLSYSKPVELCSKFIKLYSTKNVLDLFGGSGSTLIACEQLNRTCYMMELDEHYCDVIIQRWENLTGKKAERINDGSSL